MLETSSRVVSRPPLTFEKSKKLAPELVPARRVRTPPAFTKAGKKVAESALEADDFKLMRLARHHFSISTSGSP